MRNKYILLGVILLLAMGFNRYQHSDFRTEKILTSNKWHSMTEVYISPKTVQQNNFKLGPVSKMDLNSNIKYLTNKTYIRESYIKLYNHDNEELAEINIADLGKWSSKDGYIFAEPQEYIDISSEEQKGLSKEEIEVFKKLFEMETRQIRHLDKVNRNTILLTGIDNSSRVLFAN